MYTIIGFIGDTSDLMNQWFGDLLHEDKTLTTLQISLRAALVFMVALVMIHLSGRRAFGIRTPFDTVLTLLLGATLSRAIVGASSFVGVAAACGVLVGLHRLLAWISIKSPGFRRLINGESRLIYRNGVRERSAMRAALLTDDDLESAIRQQANVKSLDEVAEAFIEANGQISVVKKEYSPSSKELVARSPA
ncbi:DUF421 domain-containing protein [Spirosoma koreense]